MIELKGAGRRFAARHAPPVEALRDVTLRVPAGSVFAVVGPNGAGKTTLFALVLGFLRPTTGTVRVADVEPRRSARLRGAAWLPERFSLPGGWQVREALRGLARLEGLAPAAARTAVERELERFELTRHADRPVDALSRGLLQRLGLAQAFLAPRDLVVLDEPTQGLDPLWRIRLRTIVSELRADGRTILLASHELDEVERLADRAAVLRDGRLERIVELRDVDADLLLYHITLGTTADDDGAAGDDVSTAGTTPIAASFPGAERIERLDGHADETAATYRVRVSDSADLTRRLAALIDAGARIVSVRPARGDLEAHVRGETGGDAGTAATDAGTAATGDDREAATHGPDDGAAGVV